MWPKIIQLNLVKNVKVSTRFNPVKSMLVSTGFNPVKSVKVLTGFNPSINRFTKFLPTFKVTPSPKVPTKFLTLYFRGAQLKTNLDNAIMIWSFWNHSIEELNNAFLNNMSQTLRSIFLRPVS